MIPTDNETCPTNYLGLPTRAVILGWYDGPTAGLIEFGGSAYLFEMPDEDEQLAGGDEARRYTLAPLPADALDRFEAGVGKYLRPARPVWLPVWTFPTMDARREADAVADAIQAEAGAVEWVVEAADVTRRLLSARPAATPPSPRP